MTMECINELATFLTKGQILSGSNINETYQKDWSIAPPHCPLAVILPTSTEELARIVEVCARHKQPMVPQGGRTGLAGGATPTSDALCISLEKMNQVEDRDPQSNTITVQAGITLQQVQELALEVNRTFPINFGSRGSCQIGGVLATNAGGNNVIHDGMARQNVLGLEVVTAQGTIISFDNKMIKNNAGYDLKQLFIGSEGTLGFITKATLKLAPVAGEPHTALCALANYDNGVSLLHHMQSKLGQTIYGFEMMWEDFYRMSCDWVCADHPPFDEPYPIYVLVECRGCNEETFNAVLESAFEAELVQDAVIATSHQEREALWQIRETTTEFPVRLAPMNFDISLPIKDIDHFVHDCKSQLLAQWPDALIVNFGHIGDSNLHLTIDKRSAAGIDELKADQIIYQCVEQFHGSISAEHGVGQLKRDFLHHSVSPEALDLMRLIKRTLDPDNLLNPGKLLPPATN